MNTPADRPKRMTAIVSGHVQGVGYRRFVQRRAIDLQLAGYAENRPEGRVEVIAEGPEEELKFLYQLLRKGPPHARVEGVEIQWSESTGLEGFYVY